ncbi:MAG TPA: lipid A biosynthesis acyltransferase, partial [Thermoguttaceae bacterium]|nr:lipid A biosynthesis acyltransferase [Thermoguttaceae bacterium]
KKGGYDQIENVLADAGTMTFLADQYAGPKGCWVEFFGRPVSAHKAIGLLSLSYDAPMTVCSARRIGPMLHVELDTPGAIDPRDTDAEIASVRDLTQWYTSHFETFIRRTPGQYWWLHRRWRDPRKKRRKRKAA